MLKKLISIIISAVMLCGILSVSVNADAPLYFDGIATNVFDRSFADISSTSEAADFDFSGNWKFTGQFAGIDGPAGSSSIKTKNQIDLTDAYGYEFSTRAIYSYNAINLYLAYDETNSAGYRVNISYNDKKILLYKAGSSDPVATVDYTDPSYGAPYVWKATVDDKTLTITRSGTTVLTYTDTDAPSRKGIFGIASASTANLAVFNMKLDKLDNGATVNNWFYKKDFSSKDTAEGLAADGITVSSTAGTVSYTDDEGGLNIANPGSHTNFYYDKNLSGDFTLETQVHPSYANAVMIRFNRDSAGNYYAVKHQGTNNGKNTDNFSIIKYTVKTDTAAAATETLVKATTATGNNIKYTINIKDNEESITVTASILDASGVQETLTCDIPKAELFEETHRLQIYASAAGPYINFYYFNVYATPSEGNTGEWEGKFYIGDTEATTYTKGEIYFETPVVDLGTYTVIAALYEDDKMTDMKALTTRDLCEGKLKLFDTTASTAATGEVKVYFLDSSETLNKTKTVLTLK